VSDIDEITRQIIQAAHVRFDACEHERIVGPPPGKHLRVCLNCGFSLIECEWCDRKTFARPDIADSGWTVSGSGAPIGAAHLEVTYHRCPMHENCR
jgi:hypothetical protein